MTAYSESGGVHKVGCKLGAAEERVGKCSCSVLAEERQDRLHDSAKLSGFGKPSQPAQACTIKTTFKALRIELDCIASEASCKYQTSNDGHSHLHLICSPCSSTEIAPRFLPSSTRPPPHLTSPHRLCIGTGCIAKTVPFCRESTSTSSTMGSISKPQSRSASPASDDFNLLSFDQDLTPLPVYKPAGDAALDFGGLLPAPLKVHEDLTSGCGGQTWPAGVVLARHMLRYHREDLKDASM